MSQLYIGEGNSVSWRELRDLDTGAPINNADILGQVLDAETEAIVGLPFILFREEGSDGDYKGVITDETTDLLTEGKVYHLELVATVEGYEKAKRRIPYTAMYHRNV